MTYETKPEKVGGRKLANSGKYGYGIAKQSPSSYLATIPTVDGKYINKTFNTLQKARSWQIHQAIKEWGIKRFNIIKKGRLCILRSWNYGVSVRLATSNTLLANGHIASYRNHSVFWYDHDRKPKAKMFSPKRYGQYAELEAHWFAAKQRAILTESVLYLPSHVTIHSFDHENATTITQSKDLQKRFKMTAKR